MTGTESHEQDCACEHRCARGPEACPRLRTESSEQDSDHRIGHEQSIYVSGWNDAESRIVAWLDERIAAGAGIPECYPEAQTLSMLRRVIEKGSTVGTESREQAQALDFLLEAKLVQRLEYPDGEEYLAADVWWPGRPGSPDVCGTCGDIYCSGGLACERATDMPRAMWDAGEYHGRRDVIDQIGRLVAWVEADGRYVDGLAATLRQLGRKLDEGLEAWVDEH